MTMRLLIYLMVIGCGISYASTGYSQITELSLHVNNLTVKEVFSEIEKNSEFIFFYYDGVLDLDRKVSFELENQTIDVILDKLFENTNNNYSISDRQITITRKAESVTGPPVQSLSPNQQGITVTGVISDAYGPLPGATVFVKGTTRGTASDVDGKYTVTVPDREAVLQFTFIGYLKQEIVVGDRTVIDILLKEDMKVTDEVVIVAYAKQNRETVLASVSEVKGEVLVNMGTASLANALSGTVEGLSVIQTSGQPGSDRARIYVRGRSSWSGGDEADTPLVLVDGIERDFNDIDANEVESISILKDAAATAPYGARGADGVILVTTKRGVRGKVQISGTADLIVKTPMGVPKPLNSYQTALLYNEALKNSNQWQRLITDEALEHYRLQDDPYRYPNTDWQDYVLKKAGFSNKYNLNVSGGTEFARVFASMSYLHNGDIFNTEVYRNGRQNYDPRNYLDRFNYRFNIDLDLTGTTVLSLDAGGMISYTNSSNDTNANHTWRPMYTLGPMSGVPFYPAEVLDQYPDYLRSGELGMRVGSTMENVDMDNPGIALNYSGQRSNRVSDMTPTIQLKQLLDFVTPGLNFSGKVSLTHSINNMVYWTFDPVTWKLMPDESWLRNKGRQTVTSEAPATTVSRKNSSVGSPNRQWYYELSLNYARNFDKHAVTGLLLAWRKKNQANIQLPHYRECLLGRVTYNFDTKYMFEFNASYEGSEQFAPNNRYGFFPSFGIGWNIHREKFFYEHIPFIKNLKIRFSHGSVGSDRALGEQFLYLSQFLQNQAVHTGGGLIYMAGANFYPGITGTGTNTYLWPIYEESLANINARWEKAVKDDLGIELSFWKLSGSLTFYWEHRDGILIDPNSNMLPYMLGIRSKSLNMGESKSRGLELSFGYTQQIGNVNFWVRPRISFNDNLMVKTAESLDLPAYATSRGYRIGQVGVVEIQPEKINQNADMVMNSAPNGNSYMGLGDIRWYDFDGNGTIDGNDFIQTNKYGTVDQPLHNYGLSAGLRWGNLSFDLLLQGTDRITRNLNEIYVWPLNQYGRQVMEYQTDAWSPSNRDAFYPQLRTQDTRGHNASNLGVWSPITFRSGAYLRLKNMGLNYELPQSIINLLRVSNLSLYVRGLNILTLKSKSMPFDPEQGMPSNGAYPLTREFTAGLRITF